MAGWVCGPWLKLTHTPFFKEVFFTEFVCQNIVCGRHGPGASVWTHIFMPPFVFSLLNCSKTSQILNIWYLEINAQTGIDISGHSAAMRVPAPSKMLVFLQ